MGKVTYNGPEAQVTWGGKVMKKGESVDVTNEDILKKAFANPMFEVSGYEPKPVTTTTTTVDNPNIDLKNQPKMKEGEDTNRTSGIGTDEPLVVEQPAEMNTVYPDTRNKAETGGSGVATSIRVDPASFEGTQAASDAAVRRGPGRPPKARGDDAARAKAEDADEDAPARRGPGRPPAPPPTFKR